MTINISDLSLAQLQKAVGLREQIDSLTIQLNSILGSSSESAINGVPRRRGRPPGRRPGRRKGKMSAAGRARIVAAQKARWARERGEAEMSQSATPVKRRRKVSAAARAALSAAAKARWRKAKAAGRSNL